MENLTIQTDKNDSFEFDSRSKAIDNESHENLELNKRDFSVDDLHYNIHHMQESRAVNNLHFLKRQHSQLQAAKHLASPFSGRPSSKSFADSEDGNYAREGFEISENDEDDEFNNSLKPEDIRTSLFEVIPEAIPHSVSFQRVVITRPDYDPATGRISRKSAVLAAGDKDDKTACDQIRNCMKLRNKYISSHPEPPQDLRDFENYEKIDAATHTLDAFDRPLAFRPKNRNLITYNVFERPLPDQDAKNQYYYVMKNGVIHVYKRNSVPGTSAIVNDIESAPFLPHASTSDATTTTTTSHSASNSTASVDDQIFSVFDFEEFVVDFNTIRQAIYSGPVASYSFKRLELLDAKFSLHQLLNGGREIEAQKSVPHRDFYNVRKVDTHVHHSACMNQKHLLRYIKHKLKHNANDTVIFRDNEYLTLGEVFHTLGLTAYDLSIDTLDMHAHDTFHRFDRFNLKYNPAGQSRLREIFLKTDNYLDGIYLAEITKEVIADLQVSKYQLVEWRISIYGRKKNEWINLAKWFYNNKLAHYNVRWLIQVPRLYSLYRRSNEIQNFQEMLSNIFEPLFEATLNPSENKEMFYFLETIVGFDSVDDESRPEVGYLACDDGGTSPKQGNSRIPKPRDWKNSDNPPYGYWMYYMFANICTLNKLRASLNLCTFQFRPHCGEAGDIDHLVSTYLLAHQINHGILLRKNPGLQYLYYLSQIGIAMSPLSNNKLFLDYYKNPFIKYFKQGMNVSLSTDDPLMLHYTKDALVEEYSVATQVWKLSSADQCEIARNSVLQSGWERRYKLHFLGKDYQDIRETNVPEIRLMYRQEMLQNEISDLDVFD